MLTTTKKNLRANDNRKYVNMTHKCCAQTCMHFLYDASNDGGDDVKAEAEAAQKTYVGQGRSR